MTICPEIVVLQFFGNFLTNLGPRDRNPKKQSSGQMFDKFGVWGLFECCKGPEGSQSQEQKGDRETVMTAVSQSGWALEFATEELKGDRKIVMAALSRGAGLALRFATEELKGDAEMTFNVPVNLSAPKSCDSLRLRQGFLKSRDFLGPKMRDLLAIQPR